MKKLFHIIPALMFMALLGGCGNVANNLSTAKAQVGVFHQQFNTQQFVAIEVSADSGLFKSTSRSQFVKMLSVIHKKLGRVMSSENTNWNIQAFNGDSTVNLQQSVKFEKGNAVETFAFRIKGQKAYLLAYNINSLDLLMK